MTKILSIYEYKNILLFYNYTIPKNIFNIKKLANKIIINKMCHSNCYNNKNIKYLMFLVNKRNIISHNKKNKLNKTFKSFSYYKNKTRAISPINYLCT